MNGTSTPATLPIRLMPPMMTEPTTTARMMPTACVGIPNAISVIWPTFQAWNILPPVIAEISRVMQKSTPTAVPSGARPHEANAF